MPDSTVLSFSFFFVHKIDITAKQCRPNLSLDNYLFVEYVLAIMSSKGGRKSSFLRSRHYKYCSNAVRYFMNLKRRGVRERVRTKEKQNENYNYFSWYAMLTVWMKVVING